MPSLKELQDTTCELIATDSTDEMKIELTLDYLLDCLNLGVGKGEFCRLQEYYSTLNPENAKYYEQCYFEN